MSSPSFSVPQNQKIVRNDFIALIQETLSVLARPGQTVELRIPNAQAKRTDSGYFTEVEKLAVGAFGYDNHAEGIYITLNPLHPALLARSANRIKEYAKQTSSDKDVLRRLWIFIDFDPVRPAGISSSEEEHQAAIDRAQTCREKLAQRGIPSVLADSGNGAHLLIPIDWPNDDVSTALVKDFLLLLDKKFSDEVIKVDTGMVGASHLIKLYGTMARKGDSMRDRPHRRSMLLDVPASLNPIPPEAIQKLIAQIAAPAETAKTDAATRDQREQPTQDRSFIDEVKAGLDMVAYAEQQLGVQATGSGVEMRLPGNAGFLINTERGVWYHHGGQEGGDALDLVGYFLYDASWNKRDAGMFKQALHTAANFAGVSIPKWNKPTQDRSTKADGQPAAGTSDTTATKPEEYKLDLLDVADAWNAKYGNDLAWDADRNKWRRWIGTHWQVEKTSEMLDLQAAQMMREVGVKVYSGSRSDGVLKFARGLCKRKFLHGQPLVNFRNGTLDLSSLQLRDHARADHLTRCLPHEYADGEAYPHVRAFLDNTIPDQIAQQAYMTHIGAALVGDTSLHKTIILFGPSRSGKTTLLKLAQATLGYKPGQFPTSTLFSSEGRGANSRAAWVDSNPNLVCLDEFPQDALGGEGEELFKSMTAHGGVSMWLKYQDERDENTWTPKLMFATNNRLHYRDQSGALTRRLLIIACPNSVPDAKQDGEMLRKLEPELGAFAASCIKLALKAQKTREYPESPAMKFLLADIETNGDSIKLWLNENCVFEEGAFESTTALYDNYRRWCDENGVGFAGRPKMRDVIITYRPEVKAGRKRFVDQETGEISHVWGMYGVRLRTIEDDLDNDPDPTTPAHPSPVDPVDAVPENTGSRQEPDNQAMRSGDPVDSQKLPTIEESDSEQPNSVVESFSENDRITGSEPLEAPPNPENQAPEQPGLVDEPPCTSVVQRPLLADKDVGSPGISDKLRYHPDLMAVPSRRR